MPAVMANRGLRRLLAAAAATSLGERALFVALSVYAYREGGAALVGLVALVQAVPAVLAAPAATMLLSDRVSRRRLLLVTNLIRAALLGVIALAVAVGVAVWWVIALAAVHSTVSTANQPARAALIPVLARRPDEVSAANALLSTVNSASFLLGSGGGGVLVAATDPQTVLGLCALAYLVAVAIVVTVPADVIAPARARHGARRAAAMTLRIVLASAELRSVFVLIAALSVADGLIGVLVYVAPIEVLDMGTSGVGYLNLACGVGGLAAGTVALALRRRADLATALLLGSLVLGLPLALVGLVPHPALAIVAWICVGLGYALVKSTSLTLVQRLTPDRSLLRVLGALESIFVGCIGLGAILAPLLIELAGVRATLTAAGLLLPLVALACSGGVRRSEDGAPVPAAEFELLRAHPIFAPLPLATVESLTRRLTPVAAAAGAVVIAQGEAGDRWYLIAAGELEVVQDGIPLRRLAAGAAFGEIALLRDVPRTATVWATAPSRLLALDRETFLTAVTGVADSYEAAQAVADEHLSRPMRT